GRGRRVPFDAAAVDSAALRHRPPRPDAARFRRREGLADGPVQRRRRARGVVLRPELLGRPRLPRPACRRAVAGSPGASATMGFMREFFGNLRHFLSARLWTWPILTAAVGIVASLILHDVRISGDAPW